MNPNFELFVVSTPIGNLEDMTFRGVRTLKESKLILAEDTRHSRKLLNHYEIETAIQTYHDYNKEKVSAKYIKFLEEEGSIALISDAGTPCVADPGFYLIRECLRAGVKVTPIPGASAVLTALVPSAMPTDRFRFENFAPKKSSQRLKMLEGLKEADSTIILYASPHHLVKLLGEFQQVFGDEVELVLARELTKKFEEFLRGSASFLLEHYKERKPKGEYVFLFHPLNKGKLL